MLWGKKKPKVWLKQSLMRCQPDPNPHPGGGGHLTKGQPTHSSNTFGHEMSLWRVTSDQRSACPKQFHTCPQDVSTGEGVHLTKGQPAQSSTLPSHEMSLAMGISDQRSACSK